MGAGQPAWSGYPRLSNRSVEQPRRVSAQSARDRDPPEGDPLLEPHSDGDRPVQAEAVAAPRHGQASRQITAGSVADPRDGPPRNRGGRESLQLDPADLSRQELR